jgi:hypothetical protein
MRIFRNRFLTASKTSKVVSISESVAGDICFYDKLNDKIIVVTGKPLEEDYPLSDYTPIGIVAVPGTHKVYGENTCGIVGLTEMCASTPTIGSLNTTTLSWGPQADVGTLQNYNVVIVMNGSSLATNGFGYLSKNGKYNATSLLIPDPYDENMGRNPDYYNTSISAYNAMSDFKGKSNTDKIIELRGAKDYSTWIPTYNVANDYPAASCCNMFYTDGTSQGDWYLPAAGEWGYVMSKWTKMQRSFNLLSKVYGNIVCPLLDNSSYWTSSDHNAKNARYVHTDNGMGHTTKTTASKVRAFTILTEPI